MTDHDRAIYDAQRGENTERFRADQEFAKRVRENTFIMHNPNRYVHGPSDN